MSKMELSEKLELASKGAGLLTGKRASMSLLARTIGVQRSTVYRWQTGIIETPTKGRSVIKIDALVQFWLSHQSRCSELRNLLGDK